VSCYINARQFPIWRGLKAFLCDYKLRTTGVAIGGVAEGAGVVIDINVDIKVVRKNR